MGARAAVPTEFVAISDFCKIVTAVKDGGAAV